MACRVSLVTQSDQTLIVVKTPLDGDRLDRFAEHEWLERAQAALGVTRRAVVEVIPRSVGSHSLDRPRPDEPHSGPSPSIITRRCAGETLRVTRREPSEVARLLVDLTLILIDLHDAGLVHGKLSLDHVILGPDGPVLCSPHGTITDPTADVVGLGRCLRGLLERWREAGVTVADESEWEHLADRLGDTPGPLPLRRVVHAVERLAAPLQTATSPDAGPERSARPSGILLAVGMVALALIGLFVTNRGPAATSSADADLAESTTIEGPAAGVFVEVDGQRYQVGRSDDVAATLQTRCRHQPAVVLLDTEADRLWRFDRIEPDAPGTPMHAVPGATGLRVDDGDQCPTVWATGPAGAVLVIDNAP